MMVMCSLSFYLVLRLDNRVHEFERKFLDLLYPVDDCGFRNTKLFCNFTA